MKLFYRNNTLYYKKLNEADGIINGELTLNNGVLSGFSSDNYLILPFCLSPTFATWDFIFKVKVGPTHGHAQGIIGRMEVNHYGINLNLGAENKLQLWLSSTGESSDIILGRRWWDAPNNNWKVVDAANAMDGVTVFQEGDVVYLRVFFDGAKYQVESSFDKINWTVELSIENPNLVYTNGMPQSIGYNHADPALPYEYWSGEIDLNESIIKVGGNIIWRGLKYTTSDETDYDYYDQFIGYQVFTNRDNIKYYKYQTRTNPNTSETYQVSIEATEDDYDYYVYAYNCKGVKLGDS